jgi:conjugal transfer pilus assembly protein TraL
MARIKLSFEILASFFYLREESMNRKLKIPSRLNSPPKMLFWDLDVAMMVITGIGIGIISKTIFICLLISAALAFFWSKAKAGKHPWFFVHGIAWYLADEVSLKNERMPPNSIKEFLR